MFICEYCGNEFEKDWRKYPKGKPRFCCEKCSRGFSSKEKRQEINEKVSKKLKGRPSPHKGIIKVIKQTEFFCIKCGKKKRFRSKTGLCWKCFSYRRGDSTLYKNRCAFKFNVYDYPDKFDLSLAEEYGWYRAKNKGNNLNGVSRDHIVSINYGFKNNILPAIISHPANCRLMPHEENNKKNTENGISVKELYKKIKEWDNK